MTFYRNLQLFILILNYYQLVDFQYKTRKTWSKFINFDVQILKFKYDDHLLLHFFSVPNTLA